MAKRRIRELDIEIDELTNSIKEAATGQPIATDVIRLLSVHAKEIKKRSWLFNWHRELNEPGHEVYKLVARPEPEMIQGLVSVEDLGDHVFAHLLENAKFNRGKDRKYSGVPGNLMAYACQLSFDKGYLGFVSFISKHALIEHYIKTLGAQVLRGNRMVMDTSASRKLVDQYFNEQ